MSRPLRGEAARVSGAKIRAWPSRIKSHFSMEEGGNQRINTYGIECPELFHGELRLLKQNSGRRNCEADFEFTGVKFT